jgi:hypothetical protein
LYAGFIRWRLNDTSNADWLFVLAYLSIRPRKSKTAKLLDWSLKTRKGHATKTLERDKKKEKPYTHSPRRLTKENRNGKIRKTP